MAILQVKSVPDEVYAALGERAKREGVSMSELVIRTLKKELAKPTMAEWVEQVRQRTAGMRTIDFDSAALIRAVRDEADADWDRLWAEQRRAGQQADGE